MIISEKEKVIFDSLYDGVLIADCENKVVYVNPSYSRITKVEIDTIVGADLEKVRPGARLPKVIKTGQKILGATRKEEDVEYIVNMVPIIEEGEILGGVSILNELSDIYKLSEQLYQTKNQVKKLETYLKGVGKARYHFTDIISVDEKSQATKALAQKIAPKDSNVLLFGESGTGKELYANSIHNESERANHPFIAVNCASFDSQLLESELFGYEEGAFTGAKKGGKLGLFEIASGGTLFLDEISELDYNLQAKLLRTLQEKTVRRIGGFKEIAVDVRIISATNKSLELMLSEKRFREDLYYRIAVFPIMLYPLRERIKDIPQLIHFFMDRMANRMKRQLKMSEDAMAILCGYSWPGNIRELKNTIEFASNMTNDYLIKPENLPIVIQKEAIKMNLATFKPLSEIIKEAEIQEIHRVIAHFGHSVEGKKQAAKALGISLATLYNKLNS